MSWATVDAFESSLDLCVCTCVFHPFFTGPWDIKEHPCDPNGVKQLVNYLIYN